MDYLFRWIEQRFLSGKQLPLFGGVDNKNQSGSRFAGDTAFRT
jgi:hypothetical protein